MSNSKFDGDFSIRIHREMRWLTTNTLPNSIFPRPLTIEVDDDALLKMKNATAAEFLQNSGIRKKRHGFQTFSRISFQPVSSINLSSEARF